MKPLPVLLIASLVLLCACSQATSSSSASLSSQVTGSWTVASGSNWQTIGFDADKTYHESASVSGSSYSLTGTYTVVEPDKIDVNATYLGQSYSCAFYAVKVSGNQLTMSQTTSSGTVTVVFTKN